MKNYYEILGVSQTSDQETITAAFKALMQKLDSGTHSVTAGKNNTKEFNDVYAVLKAYEVLIDPDARREYDASLAKAKPQDVPPPTPKIPVVVEEEEVFVFPSENAFTEQQPSRWNTKIWLLPVLLLGFFLIYQIIQSKNSADPNAIVTVTVTGTANIRDAASSSGTSVLGEYPPGTTLRGRWVPGNLDPSERWLELEEGGRFVWGRNLLEVAASVASDAAEIAPPPSAKNTLPQVLESQEVWVCDFGDPEGPFTVKFSAASYEFVPYNPDGGQLQGPLRILGDQDQYGSAKTGLELVGSGAPDGRWGFIQDKGKRKALLSYAVETSGDGSECTPPGQEPQYVFN